MPRPDRLIGRSACHWRSAASPQYPPGSPPPIACPNAACASPSAASSPSRQRSWRCTGNREKQLIQLEWIKRLDTERREVAQVKRQDDQLLRFRDRGDSNIGETWISARRDCRIAQLTGEAA